MGPTPLPGAEETRKSDIISKMPIVTLTMDRLSSGRVCKPNKCSCVKNDAFHYFCLSAYNLDGQSSRPQQAAWQGALMPICEVITGSQDDISGSFVPHEAQKRASAGLAAPH